MRSLSVVSLLLLLTASTAAAQRWTPEQEEVWKAVEAAAMAYTSGDVSYETVHPDFVFWNAGNSVPGDREAARALDTAFWGAVGARMHGRSITPLTILVFDDVAAVHAYIRGYQAFGEETPKFAGIRWTSVWKKEDGKWLQALNYGHPDP